MIVASQMKQTVDDEVRGVVFERHGLFLGLAGAGLEGEGNVAEQSGGPSGARPSNSARSSIGNDRTLVGLSLPRHSRLSTWTSASEVNSRLAERRGLASSVAASAAAREAFSARSSQSGDAVQLSSIEMSSVITVRPSLSD